jgi:hypothetical protein
MPVD